MWKGSRAAADGQALETGGIATSILHGEGVPLAPWAGYVLAVAIFGAALAARFAMLPVEGGLGFLTFYPAVALAALLFGTGPGLLTMVLGAVTALYIFMPPFWAFKLVFEQMLSVATFSFSGAIICFLTHQMRHHAEELKSTMAALQRRESELARANERLQDLDRAKSEFFSNVSHEFRTPLTLMLGPLENLLAESAGTLSEESRKTLELAHRNALRLLRLVNALLDFSRMEAGRVRPNREATDLAAFTAELASHFSSACTGGGVQLIVDCPPLPQAVGVDRAMWEKIVLNLLSNAFKFTFAGSIEVRLRDLDEQVVLTVRDTGTGIPRHELPHLFERFHRVEGARGRSFEGTGIGLALIHELVRLHGGSVAVDSEQGCGSAFTVRVPFGTECLGETRLGDGAEETARHTSANAIVSEALRWLPEHAETETAPATIARGQVVVADDNQDMRTYVTRLLEAAGYAVEAVGDGEAALAACRTHLPDLLLSDVMMPGLDGFGVLKRLRADAATATLPVILLSARAGEEAKVEGLAADADDYLVKPFGARELIARVDGAIRLAQLRRKAQEKLMHYMAELERSNRELDDFAYIASHDLKEPLRGLHNYASILREDYEACLDDEGRRCLERMQRLVERQTLLIDRLLAYSRLGSSKLDKEPVALDHVLDEVAEDLRSFLSDQGVQLVRATPLPTVRCNALRVGEVFQNLIVNAAKYNDKPEKRVEIGCSGAAPPVFYVRDNGIGIAPQHQDSIFRIFKRLHEQDKFGGGTGAGLTIVKKIVERHGGRIWLESTPGEGTTFYFTLSGETP
ncbi:MAG TPA: ATP-binding protein [Methylococcaceae bacterium]|nr:ATP-binding protein [Methylococcaceae bacterium]